MLYEFNSHNQAKLDLRKLTEHHQINSRYLNITNIIVFGILLRLFIFTVSLFIPFPFGPDAPISPLHYQTGVDLGFYLTENYSIKENFFTDFNTFTNTITQFFISLFNLDFSSRYPGPVYPIIIWITSYSINNTLFLSLIVFLTEIASFLVWCKIMKNKINGYTGLFFAFMPHTIWFGILVSSDIFFYFFTSLFFYFWSKGNLLYEKQLYTIGILLLTTRPAGLAVILARKIFLLKNYKLYQIQKYIILYIFIFVLGSIYYSPYFLVEKEILNDQTSLNFTVILEKTFSMFGFQKSRTDLLLAYIIRYSYGTVFFIGFIGLLFKKNKFKIPTIITIVSVVLFLYPTWRYLLPIIPILYFSGCETIVNIRNFKRKTNV